MLYILCTLVQIEVLFNFSLPSLVFISLNYSFLPFLPPFFLPSSISPFFLPLFLTHSHFFPSLLSSYIPLFLASFLPDFLPVPPFLLIPSGMYSAHLNESWRRLGNNYDRFSLICLIRNSLHTCYVSAWHSYNILSMFFAA